MRLPGALVVSLSMTLFFPLSPFNRKERPCRPSGRNHDLHPRIRVIHNLFNHKEEDDRLDEFNGPGAKRLFVHNRLREERAEKRDDCVEDKTESKPVQCFRRHASPPLWPVEFQHTTAWIFSLFFARVRIWRNRSTNNWK